MSKKDGGPAFPQNRVWNAELAEYEDTQQFPGMSMRDYFAAKAMQGWLASMPPDAKLKPPVVARISYEIADEMLKAREA